MITWQDIVADDAVKTYIKKADESLGPKLASRACHFCSTRNPKKIDYRILCPQGTYFH